ncbi:hypothetical protein [Mucisphaera sp.]|uniref:hypothetical protein n=1 Tax=Mucisphaera sp. TaxID=2913024 RepID=UPI003D0CDCF2
MHRRTYALVAASMAVTTSAQAVTITFDDTISRTTGSGVVNYDLAHGDVITSGALRSALRETYGVRFNVDNFHQTLNANNPNAFNDPGVIFDSTLTVTRDDDLEDPWEGGNLPASTILGNMLIIQEAGVSPSTPDDEGRRPAGTINIRFDDPISSFGFDIIDLENGAEANGSNILTIERVEGSRNVRLDIPFTEFVDDTSPFYVPGLEFGDNYANEIPAFDISLLNDVIDANNLANGTSRPTFTEGIDRVRITLGGSAAIDNITFDTFIPPPPIIPTPAGFAAGLALMGLVVAKRR